MNKRLLDSKIVLYGDTRATLAEAMGLSVTGLRDKIEGRVGIGFGQREIEFIMDRYQLSPEEVVSIFLRGECHKMTQESNG